ncbi:MAG: hypothetical protein V3W20_07025 [Candidatus Neomarinimicrobiota bacterium]
MKIDTTYLQTINYDKHEGLHIRDIDTRGEAYLYRRLLNEIMEEIMSFGVVIINKPNQENNNKYDLFLYGEKYNSKLKCIVKRFKERV